ncbi:type II toxin-antitoxin system VapC family toxin [Rubrimonas cliftonensis]|uniref:PIN domain nuclease, a component of toxin-antitoxin system (PIN domain) n=1 Tax=Rubrimonas cliftonensis TaxID=89524 RepID=A0A1H4CSN7_9RHOB|nr:type II toxin-antitoxin system VapC family toxin [Rubrimonas cliftonensis]SEA63420.1 PIN domain nuclease, a component of toxin-antitoxin system (PIN domain) [Rubrimonas cliftonensis]
MTALLLDTGPFAMVLTDDPRLPATVRAQIERAERVALSVISFYEIGQKVRLGKWPAMAPFAGELLDRALADGFDPIPLSAATALSASLLDWDHRDPFDRIIAAAAQAEELPIVSPDTAFDAVGAQRLWT